MFENNANLMVPYTEALACINLNLTSFLYSPEDFLAFLSKIFDSKLTKHL